MQEMYGQVTDSLRATINSVNIAENLDDETLQKISSQVKAGYELDLTTRKHWEECLQQWTSLALQIQTEKSYPWRGSSNVKYPLLTTAAMQFNARAYPSLIPSTGKIVKVDTIGKDPTGFKLARADRVSTYMSHQILNEMPNWEEEMDKLLMILPVVGTVFKKTYYDTTLKCPRSELVMPMNIVVNYWAKNLDECERISERLFLSPRTVKERQLSKVYRDVELPSATVTPEMDNYVAFQLDESTPHELIEQHSYLDLDDDGYSEPYVITFHRSSGTILRIAARFDETTIQLNDDGTLARIGAINYYTKYGFIPNPDGGFYDIGFGRLLAPINESVNTLINQLIDSGTINNLQSGFLGKGLKLKLGEQQFVPGEWKVLNSAAEDLRKQILPLPSKEPSSVLFSLLGTLVTSGKELASIAEIFVGKMPGQNTPATTTMATIEQGMKVFTAVYKRVFRALKNEYKKLYRLNSIYLTEEKYQAVLDVPVSITDFDQENYDVCPSADPATPTQTEKLLKAQGLFDLLPLGTLDPIVVTRRMLEAEEQANIDELWAPAIKQSGGVMPEPPPDVQLQEMNLKEQLENQKLSLKQQELAFKNELKARDSQFQQEMQAQALAQKAQFDEMKLNLDTATEIRKQNIFQAARRANSK